MSLSTLYHIGVPFAVVLDVDSGYVYDLNTHALLVQE